MNHFVKPSFPAHIEKKRAEGLVGWHILPVDVKCQILAMAYDIGTEDSKHYWPETIDRLRNFEWKDVRNLKVEPTHPALYNNGGRGWSDCPNEIKSNILEHGLRIADTCARERISFMRNTLLTSKNMASALLPALKNGHCEDLVARFYHASTHADLAGSSAFVAMNQQMTPKIWTPFNIDGSVLWHILKGDYDETQKVIKCLERLFPEVSQNLGTDAGFNTVAACQSYQSVREDSERRGHCEYAEHKFS